MGTPRRLADIMAFAIWDPNNLINIPSIVWLITVEEKVVIQKEIDLGLIYLFICLFIKSPTI